ncbi:MAG TPA: DUF177 domain-containing protein [Candidatus Fermentibacter daniensis]|jgi:uncharacterized protein|nr:MAG: hypothetical protein AO394_05865 [Candidatus Fermentibacter daniensis]MBP7719058.1 DUF177 domain-containing protein [Candidatus Fermentibacter sp.]OQC70013.1 MAG: hypothetical protein BWX47_00744 [candidate division Hyd24-12 bacterium ADurb.Bin004]KZD17634.1 MAG: hypothetical protein AO396_03020 [Candidatus Fermentibacter daniensis]KZD19443.1 MAG: hypothetical protein AO395_00065 [Candidatus Fermentibacter daniensis]
MMQLDPRDLTLDIASLRTGSNTGSFEIDTAAVDWRIEDVTPETPGGTLDLDVNYTDRSIIVRGRFRAGFATVCARCLEKAVFEVTEEVFAAYSKDGGGDADADVERLPRDGRSLPLLDAVREAVILSLPGKPLCREDCRGLCQVCGENLNVSRCGHEGASDAGCVR